MLLLKTLIKSYSYWFICFGLSLLIKSLGFLEQGEAFFFLYFAITIIMVIHNIRLTIDKTSLLGILIAFGMVLGFSMLESWIASKLFNIDIYIIFQIITFGKCSSTKNKKAN